MRFALFPFIAVFVACTPSNKLMPLRGEDPVALGLSKDRKDWLKRTGATEAVKAFRRDLCARDFQQAVSRLGPATLAAMSKVASDLPKVLAAGRVPGLSLEGADDPVAALSAKGVATFAEVGPFDPRRTSAVVIVEVEGKRIEVPAVFTEDGWRVELVRLFDASSGSER